MAHIPPAKRLWWREAVELLDQNFSDRTDAEMAVAWDHFMREPHALIYQERCPEGMCRSPSCYAPHIRCELAGIPQIDARYFLRHFKISNRTPNHALASRQVSDHTLEPWLRWWWAQCEAHGIRPSREDDVAAAKAKFGETAVTHDRVKRLRADIVPASWKAKGRRSGKKSGR